MLFLLLAATLPVTSFDPPASWSRFRGPDGAGISADGSALPDTLDPERNRLWLREVDAGNSSPCLFEERVFITGSAGNELATWCIDRASGSVLWRRAVTAPALERAHEINGPASPTPTTDGAHVVAYFGSFGLVCYDLDGRELWRRPLPMPRNTFGTAASPIFVDGRLVFLNDADDGSSLEALDPATGATLWRHEREGFRSGWSTPGTRRVGGAEELLVYGVWWLSAYDPQDGSERWSFPGLTDEPIITPVAGEGLVFVTSYNMRTNPEVLGLPPFADLVAELDRDGDGMLDADEARANESVLSRPDADGEGDHPLSMFFRYLDVGRDGEIDGDEWKKLVAWVESWEHANGIIAIRPHAEGRPAEIAWQFPRGVPECPSPLVYRGNLYVVMNGGLVTCLDARTGGLRFQERLGARGPYYASLVAGDGKIWAASARGEVTVFRAGDALQILSAADLDERLMATPALQRGVVYVRTDRHLHAFGRAL